MTQMKSLSGDVVAHDDARIGVVVRAFTHGWVLVSFDGRDEMVRESALHRVPAHDIAAVAARLQLTEPPLELDEPAVLR